MKAISTAIIVFSMLAAGTAISMGTQDSISDNVRAAMIASCAACHGGAGEGNEARSAPRLAGLDAAYIERQLDLFASGRRGTAQGDSFGPQMYVIAQSLKPADRKAAASHYASANAPSPPSTLASINEAQGRMKFHETCAACHGEDGMGNRDIGAPRIAGQADWYILASLQAFHSGARGYDKKDIEGQQMVMALAAIEAADLDAISAYAASLGPD